jgi:hypothetical protein
MGNIIIDPINIKAHFYKTTSRGKEKHSGDKALIPIAKARAVW